MQIVQAKRQMLLRLALTTVAVAGSWVSGRVAAAHVELAWYHALLVARQIIQKTAPLQVHQPNKVAELL